MKYIKNTLDYSVKFKVRKDNKDVEFVFDCFRVYTDTGNVITSGVTPIADEDYDWLYKSVPQFTKFVDSGLLVNSKKSSANSVASKIDDLSKENEALKKQLAETKKQLGTGETEETKKLKETNSKQEAVISNLKAQLEALTKGKKGKKDKADETEGF